MAGPIIREERIGDCRLIQGDCLEVMPLIGKVDAVDNSNAVAFSDGYEQSAIRQHRTAERGGENMGGAEAGDCRAIPERKAFSGINGSAIRGKCGSFSEGDSPHGYTSKMQGQSGQAERAIHRRDTIDGLQEYGGKETLQQVRDNGTTCNPSQGRSAHEQRSRELGSSVQPLSQQPPQTRVVEFEEGWAIITDPPYGIGIDGQTKRIKGKKSDRKGYEFKGWDRERPEDALRMIAQSECPKIIWGGNYFADLFPAGEKWLSWDKGQRINQSDCELAYTNLKGALRVFTLNRVALMQDGAQHPTQKPIALMQWCLGFLPNAETILDPFMGSGTTLVACAKLGRKGVGIELDREYFDIACKRVEDAYRQPDLFVPKPQPIKQDEMDI